MPDIEFITRTQVTQTVANRTIVLNAPTGIQVSRDLLVAFIVGAPSQPDNAWAPTDGVEWVSMPPVLHMGRFYRVPTPDDATTGKTYTFAFPTGTSNDMIGIVALFRHVHQEDPVASFSGWPVCEDPASIVCNGKDGNEPNPGCYATGCPDFTPPTVSVARRGSMFVATFACHDEAGPVDITQPIGYNEITNKKFGRLQLISGYLLVQGCAQSVGGVTATPGNTGWNQAIATMMCLNSASDFGSRDRLGEHNSVL